MVRLPRVSLGTNWMTTLSVTMRTASLSTSGTLRPTGARLAGARGRNHRADHRRDEAGAAGAERGESEEGSAKQLQGPNSMACLYSHSGTVAQAPDAGEIQMNRERL